MHLRQYEARNHLLSDFIASYAESTLPSHRVAVCFCTLILEQDWTMREALEFVSEQATLSPYAYTLVVLTGIEQAALTWGRPCYACGSRNTYHSPNSYDSVQVCRDCHAEEHRPAPPKG